MEGKYEFYKVTKLILQKHNSYKVESSIHSKGDASVHRCLTFSPLQKNMISLSVARPFSQPGHSMVCQRNSSTECSSCYCSDVHYHCLARFIFTLTSHNSSNLSTGARLANVVNFTFVHLEIFLVGQMLTRPYFSTPSKP